MYPNHNHYSGHHLALHPSIYQSHQPRLPPDLPCLHTRQHAVCHELNPIQNHNYMFESILATIRVQKEVALKDVVEFHGSGFPPFLPSFLHLHHQHRPSSSVIEIAQISMVIIIIISVPSPLPSILPCSVLPSSINHISTTVMLVSLASSLSLSASCRSEQAESIPGIFEGIENKMLFKNQRNSWNFSSQKWKKIRKLSKEKSQRNVWESVLAKIPGIFGLFATARFYNSKRY